MQTIKWNSEDQLICGLKEEDANGKLEAEQRKQNKVLKRIEKRREKVMRSFKRSKKNTTHPNDWMFQSCVTSIPRLLEQNYFFLFNGFVSIELERSRSDCTSFGLSSPSYIAGLMMLRVDSIEKLQKYYVVKPCFHSISTRFDVAIYQLEHQLTLQSYETAQLLKKYQVISEKQSSALLKIQSKCSIDQEWIGRISRQRQSAKEAAIRKYIFEHFNSDDDFFLFNDVGVKFGDMNMSPSMIGVSSNMFALLGIDEEYVASFLARKDAFMRVIPSVSRQRLSVVQMEAVVEAAAGLQAEEKFRVLKDFEIQTIDGIVIHCDARLLRCPVEYSGGDLEYSEELMAVFNSDCEAMVGIVQLIITEKHIEVILRERSLKQFFMRDQEKQTI